MKLTWKNKIFKWKRGRHIKFSSMTAPNILLLIQF